MSKTEKVEIIMRVNPEEIQGTLAGEITWLNQFANQLEKEHGKIFGETQIGPKYLRPLILVFSEKPNTSRQIFGFKEPTNDDVYFKFKRQWYGPCVATRAVNPNIFVVEFLERHESTENDEWIGSGTDCFLYFDESWMLTVNNKLAEQNL